MFQEPQVMLSMWLLCLTNFQKLRGRSKKTEWDVVIYCQRDTQRKSREEKLWRINRRFSVSCSSTRIELTPFLFISSSSFSLRPLIISLGPTASSSRAINLIIQTPPPLLSSASSSSSYPSSQLDSEPKPPYVPLSFPSSQNNPSNRRGKRPDWKWSGWISLQLNNEGGNERSEVAVGKIMSRNECKRKKWRADG